jgi:pesticin/yersiniabactin receptor
MGKEMARRGTALTWALLAPALGFAVPAWGQDAADAETETIILRDGVTVTTNKHEQRLAEVDGSVSVRTAEELRAAGVTKVEELDKVFPGLVIRMRGNRAYSNISMRGISSNDFYNPAVAVYVDGVPQDPAYFTQELMDVERVELLRGPQGTLYGRNAHAGVINVITRRPDNEMRARIGGTFASKERGADAGIAGPIVKDALYGAVDLRWSNEDGWIDDIATGEHNIDDSETLNGRVKLRLAPMDSNFDVAFTAQHEEVESNEELYILDSRLDEKEFDSATQGGVNEIKRNVETYALTASYDFGPASLTSITSYQDRDIGTRLIQGFDTPEFQDTIAEELRLNFEIGERWNGLVGLYFQDTNFDRHTPSIPLFIGESVNQVDTQSYAAFGELTFAITDSVDITGGLRWSHEDARIEYDRQDPLGFDFEAEDDFEEISPKLALGWQVTEDQRLYTVASRGFKPGGFNHALPFVVSTDDQAIAYDSETSTNLELGWRGNLLDGRIQAGAAAYWILTEDKQIYVGPIGSQVLRNVGDAESYGVELDARFIPWDPLTIDLGVTLGEAEFTDAGDELTGQSFDGNEVPYAPDQTVQLAVTYLIPFDALPGDLSLRVAGTYFSRTYFDEANTLSQGGYALLDASLDLALDNGASVSLFADNITDEIYRTYSYESAGDAFSSIGDGRVVGVTGSVRF